MRTLPPEPNPGDPVSANLIRNLIRAIRERTIIQGHGVKTSTGPNGTTISAAPGNKGSSYTPTPSVYDIDSLELADNDLENESCHIEFSNPYYGIGGKIYEGEDEIEEVPLPSVVGLRISAVEGTCELDYWLDVAALISEQQNISNYLIPLYAFDEEGSVVCDFRNIPLAGMGEF